jgi:hypothetical protein
VEVKLIYKANEKDKSQHLGVRAFLLLAGGFATEFCFLFGCLCGSIKYA